MQRVAVIEARCISAMGDLDDTWKRLLAGRTAVMPVEVSALGAIPAAAIKDLGSELGSRTRIARLLDLLLQPPLALPDKTPVVVATTKGAIDDLHSAADCNNAGLPWNLPEEIAGRLGTRGPSFTVSAACSSGLMAVISGMQYIVTGQAPVVVALGIEVLSTFVMAGFSSLKALTVDVCRPFDALRNGLALGEGAGLLVLANKKEARKRGWPVLATIAGFGTACDARHITAPCREASGLRTTIEQATDHGRMEIGAIHAHGTGTVYNDAMEQTAFEAIWGESIPPVHSVKGAIGHCLGAAGIIESAITIKSLYAGLLPPTVGLRSQATDESRPWISGGTALPFGPKRILKCNSGFGGINASVVFEG